MFQHIHALEVTPPNWQIHTYSQTTLNRPLH